MRKLPCRCIRCSRILRFTCAHVRVPFFHRLKRISSSRVTPPPLTHAPPSSSSHPHSSPQLSSPHSSYAHSFVRHHVMRLYNMSLLLLSHQQLNMCLQYQLSHQSVNRGMHAQDECRMCMLIRGRHRQRFASPRMCCGVTVHHVHVFCISVVATPPPTSPNTPVVMMHGSSSRGAYIQWGIGHVNIREGR